MKNLTYTAEYIAHRDEHHGGVYNPMQSAEFKRDIEAAKPRHDPRSPDDHRKGVTIQLWWRRWRSGAYNRADVVRRKLIDYCDVMSEYELFYGDAKEWTSVSTALRGGGKAPRSRWARDATAMICSDLRMWLSDVESDLFL